MVTENFPLDSLAPDRFIQVRASVDEGLVATYADQMALGANFPPIDVFDDGGTFYLADGTLRARAAYRLGRATLPAHVRRGTKEDALWFALGTNRTLGLKLLGRDLKHAIELAVTQWPDKSSTLLADHIGCSRSYCGEVRAKLRQHVQVSGSGTLSHSVTGQDGKHYPATIKQAKYAAKREEIRGLLEAGKTAHEIKEQAHTSYDTIVKVRQELGMALALPKTKKAVQERQDRIRQMANEGYSSHQIAGALGIRDSHVRSTARRLDVTLRADEVIRKSHRHDSNRIVSTIVMDAENLLAGVSLINLRELDPAQLADWVRSLQRSRGALGMFIKRLQEHVKHGKAA